MRSKKVANSEDGPRHVTPVGRSVFYGLFPAERAAKIEIRAQLLMGLEQWLDKSRITQGEAAKVLGVTQARVLDLKRGKINRFSGPVGTLGSARGTQAQAEAGGMRARRSDQKRLSTRYISRLASPIGYKDLGRSGFHTAVCLRV